MQNDPNGATGEAVPAPTRRAFLRTAATAGASVAAGGMAIMATPSHAAGHPDAELLALGAEFDRAFAAYKIAAVHASNLADAFHAKNGTWPRKAEQRHNAYAAAYGRDVDPAIVASDDAARVADKLAIRIRSIPAKTLAGVAVKARTLRYDLCKWGDDPEPMSEWDWDDFCLESFIRGIQEIGGGPV
ncbi:hypothetical protein GCM10011390_10440 [Aureimonas endophytica]|uniref:Uncharacterized protein n=1 Tax=Aureimonas endophytica TaxID=2027858 RepID=A0A917E1T1_9HYPH|nr:twin-arginine translocation signal domain-containing protein [Aureimonas endophytica]GGD93615.1 hypothetical protein GCM10011390_10440 [Aureimonas endophytica]